VCMRVFVLRVCVAMGYHHIHTLMVQIGVLDSAVPFSVRACVCVSFCARACPACSSVYGRGYSWSCMLMSHLDVGRVLGAAALFACVLMHNGVQATRTHTHTYTHIYIYTHVHTLLCCAHTAPKRREGARLSSTDPPGSADLLFGSASMDLMSSKAEPEKKHKKEKDVDEGTDVLLPPKPLNQQPEVPVQPPGAPTSEPARCVCLCKCVVCVCSCLTHATQRCPRVLWVFVCVCVCVFVQACVQKLPRTEQSCLPTCLL
jgi:hypothetical protein